MLQIEVHHLKTYIAQLQQQHHQHGNNTIPTYLPFPPFFPTTTTTTTTQSTMNPDLDTFSSVDPFQLSLHLQSPPQPPPPQIPDSPMPPLPIDLSPIPHASTPNYLRKSKFNFKLEMDASDVENIEINAGNNNFKIEMMEMDDNHNNVDIIEEETEEEDELHDLNLIIPE